MDNIRSFHPKTDHLDDLHRWADELNIDGSIVSKLKPCVHAENSYN